MTRANLNAARDTTQHYTSFFVQDTWRVGNRLTINPGLRYEQQTLVGTIIDDFTLQEQLGAAHRRDLRPDRQRPAKVVRELRPLLRAHPERPRRARAVVRRRRQPRRLLRRGPDAADSRGRADRDADPGGTPHSLTQHFQLQGAGADVIDPDAKLSYVDEFVGGFECEACPNVNLGVRYIHRNIGARARRRRRRTRWCACDLGSARAGSVDYMLTNPSASSPTC